MAIKGGMLERFKSMASPDDEVIAKVVLIGNDHPVYGYIREVESDYFVIQEVKREGSKPNDIVKADESTFHLDRVETYSKVQPKDVPRPPGTIQIGTIRWGLDS